MIFNTTSAEVLDLSLNKSLYHAFLRQLLYACMGIVFAFGVYKAGYKKILEFSPMLLVFFTFLLALTLLPGVGREVNGAKRWISLFGFSLQPSEFIKYIIPAYVIHCVCTHGEQNNILKMILMVSFPICLILLQPNNGTALVLVATLVLLLFLLGSPVKYWGAPIVLILLVGGISAYQLPYVSARLKVYWNPELDRLGKGHQPYQAKIAAGSGELWGKGPGNSLQKLSYLPEAQNDYIAAIYAEEFGFMGIVLLIFLYMVLTALGFSIAYQNRDRSAFFLGASVTSLIALQAFLNLAVVSGLLPSTGLNLPLFSQGGSSLIANILAISTVTSTSS